MPHVVLHDIQGRSSSDSAHAMRVTQPMRGVRHELIERLLIARLHRDSAFREEALEVAFA